MKTLVLHFNAFTGKLEGGYFMDAHGAKAGVTMRPAEVLAVMTANPDVRCAPLKV